MKIRKEQISALDKPADDELAERIAGYLREKQTLWVERFDDEQLRERIHNGMARARDHGFEWESSLAKYVGLMFRYAPNFDEDPVISTLLARKDVPSEERADLLFTEISATHWEQVAETYDPAAWDDR